MLVLDHAGLDARELLEDGEEAWASSLAVADGDLLGRLGSVVVGD